MGSQDRISLSCVKGALAGRSFSFEAKDRIKLGRHPECDLVLPAEDNTTSGRHTELRFRDDRWWLRDLGSKNGTLIDGQPIQQDTPLASGLRFELGVGGPVFSATLPDQTALDATMAVDPGAAAAIAAAGAQPAPAGPGASSGRTAYYRQIMVETVKKTSWKLKLMIAVLAVLLVAGGVIAAVVISQQAEETNKLHAEVEDQKKETKKLDEKLAKTREKLKNAQKQLDGARGNLAETSGRLSQLRVELTKAEGESKRKLEQQAKELEQAKTRYEAQLKQQEEALAKLKKGSQAAETIAAKYEKSLFMLIENRPGKLFGFCTAFAINTKGLLATNSHCLPALRALKNEGLHAVARMNRDPSKTYRVANWRAHPKYGLSRFSTDVAWVQLDLQGGALPVACQLASADTVLGLKPGQPIYTMGFPGKVMNEARPAADFRAAVISRLTNFHNSPGAPAAAMMVWHSALTSKGTSGSPIFNGEGEVIAVNTGGLGAQYVVTQDPITGQAKRTMTYDATGLNFGIRIDALQELLR